MLWCSYSVYVYLLLCYDAATLVLTCFLPRINKMLLLILLLLLLYEVVFRGGCFLQSSSNISKTDFLEHLCTMTSISSIENNSMVVVTPMLLYRWRKDRGHNFPSASGVKIIKLNQTKLCVNWNLNAFHEKYYKNLN